MSTEINPIGINPGLFCQEVRCGQNILHFTEKAFLESWIFVASSERRIHRDNSRFAKGASGLIIIRGSFFEEVITDRVAVSSRDPDDGGILLSIIRNRGQISGQLPCGGIISNFFGDGRWRFRDGLATSLLPQQASFQSTSGLLVSREKILILQPAEN